MAARPTKPLAVARAKKVPTPTTARPVSTKAKAEQTVEIVDEALRKGYEEANKQEQ